MSPAVIAAILALVQEGIQAMPSIIADIEALIAASKGVVPAPAS